MLNLDIYDFNIITIYRDIHYIFFATSYTTWYVTERQLVPEFLDYKPFQCRTCLTFWSLVAIYVGMGIIFHLWIALIGGIVLAILNAIAMYIDQKNKTIKLDDYEMDK